MSELKKITKTLTILAYPKGAVFLKYLKKGESKYLTSLSTYVPERSEGIVLGTVDVDYEIPTDDRYFDEKQIEILKAKKAAIIAKSRMEQTQIEAEIQSLMALEQLA